jgi:hypothetical protein
MVAGLGRGAQPAFGFLISSQSGKEGPEVVLREQVSGFSGAFVPVLCFGQFAVLLEQQSEIVLSVGPSRLGGSPQPLPCLLRPTVVQQQFSEGRLCVMVSGFGGLLQEPGSMVALDRQKEQPSLICAVGDVAGSWLFSACSAISAFPWAMAVTATSTAMSGARRL